MTNSFLNFIIDLLKNSNKILKRRANDIGTDERKGDDSERRTAVSMTVIIRIIPETKDKNYIYDSQRRK